MPNLRATVIPSATGPSLAEYRAAVYETGEPCREGPPFTVRELGAATGRQWSHLSHVENAQCFAGERLIWDLARGYSSLLECEIAPSVIRAAYSVTLRRAQRRKTGMYGALKPETPEQADARARWEAGEGPGQIARSLALSPETVRRWVRRWRQES